MDEWRRSGQIPAFGDWEKANEMPITQYFESARQAGLIRHSSSGDFDLYMQQQRGDDYSSRFQDLSPPRRKANRVRERRRMSSHGKEQRKQGKVYDVTQQPPKKQISMESDSSTVVHTRPKFPKPVDEDLYKIPPHLLRSSKRKKLPRLFSCLVPSCAS
ncbi:uncharacterized protein [Euphorbia lathyris]|uniref:uncharacterized protein n=1 Tax=Euphorbia lathyris TaxID=212925 RepID=UPI003313BE58